MKILQVISTPPYAWATGGCARVAFDLSRSLVDRGHNVTIATTDMYKPNERYKIRENPERVAGLKIYRFKTINNWLAWKYKFFFSPGLIRFIKKYINEFDIVHLQDLLSIHALATAKSCKKLDIPYVLTTHGSIPWLNRKKMISKFFNKFFADEILKNASKITALNKTEFDQCKKMGVDADKIEIVPNGIVLSEYENLPKRGIFRKKYGINDDEKVVLYLGRLHKIKGLDLLVGAFSDLAKRKDNVTLVIAGPDDGYLSTLIKIIKHSKIDDKVIFTGPLYSGDKLEAYIDADVYVLPSVYEIFGITVLEAWACGTPVIVTDRCGIANLINKKTGFVCGCNSNGLLSSITALIYDSEMSDRFCKEGKRVVSEKFCMSKIAEQVEKIYAECIESSLKN